MGTAPSRLFPLLAPVAPGPAWSCCWPAWWEVTCTAGAVQLRALTGATTVPAAHAALATAAGHWTLTAAALAGAVALALACIGRRRTGARPSPGRSRDPE